jgi:Na+/melibiose symporter-like transporter
VSALFPDKFQTDASRRKARAISTPLGMLAMPVAFIIPPFIIKFGVQSSYITMAWLCVIIILIVSLLFLPGMHENKALIDRYYISEKVKPEGFLSALKSSIKQTNYLVYIILGFGFQVVIQSLTGSIAYAVNFVLQASPFFITMLFASFLTGGIISVPFWIWLAKRLKNNKKTVQIGGIALICGTFLTFFYVDEITSMIYNFILGFTMGNFWTILSLIFADCLDERIVLIKSDQRGAAVGVDSFFSRLARGVQVAIFAIVHTLTGFVEGKASYAELAAVSPNIQLALIGIRLQMSVIPCFVLVICTIVFWKYYKITPESMVKIKAQMKELGF